MAQRLRSVVGGLAVLLSACAAQAGSLVYTPVNPAFGGSPLNSNWMISPNRCTNQFKDSGKSAISGPSALGPRADVRQPADQPALCLAGKPDHQILFGANAQTSGSYTLAGTTISFVRVGGEIQITINDGSTITGVTCLRPVKRLNVSWKYSV